MLTQTFQIVLYGCFLANVKYHKTWLSLLWPSWPLTKSKQCSICITGDGLRCQFQVSLQNSLTPFQETHVIQ